MRLREHPHKYVVAPMVEQSELAWRVLARMYGADLCYTPMIHSGHFAPDNSTVFRRHQFDMDEGSLEGSSIDRPLVVQFCANDPEAFTKSCSIVAPRCDAVDLNLGCPQGIARRGRYGSFLMEDADLVRDILKHAVDHLDCSVTAKIRIHDDPSDTEKWASAVANTGIDLLTVHGRTRENKGFHMTACNWDAIKNVRTHLHQQDALRDLPVVANGGVPDVADVPKALKGTECDGVMSAEGHLNNPLLFAPYNAERGRDYVKKLPGDLQDALKGLTCLLDAETPFLGCSDMHEAAYAPCWFVAMQYLTIVRHIRKPRTTFRDVKAHMFRLFYTMLGTNRFDFIRDMLVTVSGSYSRGSDEHDAYEAIVDEYMGICHAARAALAADVESKRLPRAAMQMLSLGHRPTYAHSQAVYHVKSTEQEAPPVHAECANAQCPNNGAGKCAFAMCVPCCTAKSARDGVRCDFHSDKADARKRRKELQAERQHKKLRPANGDTKGPVKVA